jgi:hypothetical protein
MDDVVKELVWWFFSRIIAPLLLLLIVVQLWQNYQDNKPVSENVESRQVKFDNSTFFTLNRLQK